MQNRGSNIPQQGNNNITIVEGDRVLKKPNSSATFMLEQSYEQQVTQWNKYYAGTQYATALITTDGKLSTPYIAGTYPTDEQRLAICKEMMKKGFLMVDCRDKRNFLVNEDGKVCPVDFGQMYTPEKPLYKVHLRVIQKEMDRLQSQIASPPKKPVFGEWNIAQSQPATQPHQSGTQGASNKIEAPEPSAQDMAAFEAIEIYIEELVVYKEKLENGAKDALIEDKITKIDSFITDTRTRIHNYKEGDKQAFDGYIEANKVSLEVLAKNRVARPILFSVLLSLMVVPAILGAIQLAITQGNSYLFVSAVKESEKRALKVQQKVVEVKETLFSEKKSGPEETASNAEKKSDKGFDF